MQPRTLVLLSLLSFLAACSSDAPQPPVQAQPPAIPAKPVIKAPAELGPLPAYQRELSGSLLGIPAGAEVELALLVIDDRGRPQRLLSSAKQIGNNQPVPFQLRFNPDAFPNDARVELRGRASQAGQLILHMEPVVIAQPTTQALGALQMDKAP